MAGKRSPKNPSLSQLTSPPDKLCSNSRSLRYDNSHHIPDGTGAATQSSDTQRDWIASSQALLAMTDVSVPAELAMSLRANGSRERAPDDRFREAIHRFREAIQCKANKSTGLPAASAATTGRKLQFMRFRAIGSSSLFF
jgi:hypothetical protein